jgi:transcription elongation factor Elf1
MRILDVTCPSCASVYEVAESLSAEGSPGRAECTVCGKLLESWQEPKLRAYRLLMPLEHK